MNLTFTLVRKIYNYYLQKKRINLNPQKDFKHNPYAVTSMTEKVDNNIILLVKTTRVVSWQNLLRIKAIFTQYQIAFMSPQKSYWIGILFTNKNSCGGAISVTEKSCAAPISQVENHIRQVFILSTIV